MLYCGVCHRVYMYMYVHMEAYSTIGTYNVHVHVALLRIIHRCTSNKIAKNIYYYKNSK